MCTFFEIKSVMLPHAPPAYGEYSPNPKLLFSHFSASAENGGTFDGWLGYDCNSCIFNECRNFLCYGCLLLLFRFLSICSRRRYVVLSS